MTRHFRRIWRGERGMAFVFVGLSLVAFMAATTIAIDVGMMMTARSQAQNSADSGALAGAIALVFNSYTDRSATGPAVTSALEAARSNSVIHATPSVLPADVTFPLGPTGLDNRVQVSVYRTSARGNPLTTFIGPMFGVPTANVGATAVAEASPANAEQCVLPFTIPDKWIENSDGHGNPDGPWSPAATFDIYATTGPHANNGAALSNPDVYVPPGGTGPTGYSPVTDKGVEMVLKAGTGDNINPSFYNPWDLPGSVGGNDYRNNIANCNTNIIAIGDAMTPENGNMVGPTKQGTDALVAKDPGAYWDTGCNCVMGSAFGVSPRIGVVPLYDPVLYASGQQTGKSHPDLRVVNYVGFFIEGISGGDVTGRLTPITGLFTGSGPAPAGAFPKAIRLVQ